MNKSNAKSECQLAVGEEIYQMAKSSGDAFLVQKVGKGRGQTQVTEGAIKDD